MRMKEFEQQAISDFLAMAEESRKRPETLDVEHLPEIADQFYMRIESPANPPLAVRRAIVNKFLPQLWLACEVLRGLGYDGLNGCYYFVHAGVYHGVEPDGYIHT